MGNNADKTLEMNDFFNKCGFTTEDLKHVKLIRYSLENSKIKKIYDLGFIEEFQHLQNENDVEGCKYILSFIGDTNRTARLVGCFEVLRPEDDDSKNKHIPKDYPFPKHFKDSKKYYLMTELPAISSYNYRLTVKWKSKKSQFWANDSIVNEMSVVSTRTPVSSILFENRAVSYSELKEIITNQDLEWKIALSNINAVYIIRSTYGKFIWTSTGYGNLWKCWKKHIEGKNEFAGKKLKYKNSYTDFQYSILEILSKDEYYIESCFEAIKYRKEEEFSSIPDLYEENK